MHLASLTFVLAVGATAQAPSAPISFSRLPAADLVIPEPGTAVIRDDRTWRTLWRYFGREYRSAADPALLDSMAAPPVVDFGRYMVIALASGRTSGCSNEALLINRIEATADLLRVVVGPDSAPEPVFCIESGIAPIDAVVVPRDRRRVVFVGAGPEYPIPRTAEWWRRPSVDAALGRADGVRWDVSWRVLARDSTLPVADLRRLVRGMDGVSAGSYGWSLVGNPRVADHRDLLAILGRTRSDAARRARRLLFERHAIPVARDAHADTAALGIVIDELGYGAEHPDIAILLLENPVARRHEPLLRDLFLRVRQDETLCRQARDRYAPHWPLHTPLPGGGSSTSFVCAGDWSGTEARASIVPRVGLEHICGTTFRAVNSYSRQVEVTWEVEGTNARGGLVIPAPAKARLRGEAVLTTGQPGVIRLYVDGSLIEIHANTGARPCQSAADTSPPPRVVPAYCFPADVSSSVAAPGESVRYYRRIVRIEFGDAATDQEIARVLRRAGTLVLSGGPPSRVYLLRVRESGSSWEAYVALRAQLAEAPGVVDVVPVAVRGC